MILNSLLQYQERTRRRATHSLGYRARSVYRVTYPYGPTSVQTKKRPISHYRTSSLSFSILFPFADVAFAL